MSGVVTVESVDVLGGLVMCGMDEDGGLVDVLVSETFPVNAKCAAAEVPVRMTLMGVRDE